MMNRILPLLLACAASGCSAAALTGPAEVCSGFTPWEQSPYVLPYPPGTSYVLDQGNCSPPGNGHRGVGRYAYDFLMPIGTTFTAATAGRVIHVEESHRDGEIADTGKDNYIAVAHDDGTVDIYGHVTGDGANVSVGDVIAQGDVLGRSGNTGNTNNIPHLHYSHHSCDPVTRGSDACPTLPVTFRNTMANPRGPETGKRYTALAL